MLYQTMPNIPIDKRPFPMGTKRDAHRSRPIHAKVSNYWSSVKTPAAARTPFTYLTHGQR